MAAPCKKCDPHEICEECPEWIFTLADLIMCMMGLFVLLWVLKPGPTESARPGDDEQLTKVLASIRDYFQFLPDSNNPDKVDIYRLMKKLQDMKPMRDPGDGGPTKLEKQGAEGDNPDVISIRPGKQSIVGSRALFPQGSAELTNESKKVLDQVAMLIKGHRNVMFVKGHTSLDDLGENATGEQQRDLSIRRANAATDYLVSKGVSPDILRVVGCSTSEPVVLRAYTPESRRLNRRVEIESTTTLVAELQDRPVRAPVGPDGSPSDPAGGHAQQHVRAVP